MRDQMVRSIADHPYAEYSLWQIHRFSGGGTDFTSVRMDGDSTHVVWCENGELRWLGLPGHRAGNSLDTIDAGRGLYELRVGKASSMYGYEDLFVIDVSSGSAEILLSTSSLIDGMTSWSPPESALHTVKFDYPRLQLVEKWRYDREGAPLDSGEQTIALTRDSATGVLFQKMVHIERVTFDRSTMHQESDTTLVLNKEVPVVETRMGMNAYIDGYWHSCWRDSLRCRRDYGYGTGMPTVPEVE